MATTCCLCNAGKSAIKDTAVSQQKRESIISLALSGHTEEEILKRVFNMAVAKHVKQFDEDTMGITPEYRKAVAAEKMLCRIRRIIKEEFGQGDFNAD